MEIVSTTRRDNHEGVPIDDGAGEHAFALLARLAACCVQLDGGHASGLPAPLAKGDGKAGLVEDVHGLQNEIARHKRHRTAVGYEIWASTCHQ